MGTALRDLPEAECRESQINEDQRVSHDGEGELKRSEPGGAQASAQDAEKEDSEDERDGSGDPHQADRPDHESLIARDTASTTSSRRVDVGKKGIAGAGRDVAASMAFAIDPSSSGSMNVTYASGMSPAMPARVEATGSPTAAASTAGRP